MPPFVSRAVRHARNSALSRAEAMRASLPLGMYLNILHEAAVTGEMPVLSMRGERTEQRDPVTPQERLKLLQYLVDKCMGPVNAVSGDPMTSATDALRTLTPEQLRSMTLDELRVLMTPQDEAETIDVTKAAP